MERIDVHTHVGVDLLFYFGGGYPYASDFISLVTEGRRHGLSRWVVFPMVTHAALSISAIKEGKVQMGDDALEAVPYAFENERMLREIYTQFGEEGALALPLLMLDPSREQQAQVKALEYLHKKYRIYGLKIQATIIQSPIRDLLGEGSVLMDFARRENLPVLIHTSINPADTWSQVADILDVARANPDVRFCLAHSCRFDRAGLDEVARLPNTWFDCSAHVIHCRLAAIDHPAVALGQARFPSDYTSPKKVLADLAAAYPEKLMWGSDAPFYSYVSPAEAEEGIELKCSYEEEAAPLLALPEQVQQKIAHDNILKFLGLPQLP